MRSWRTMKFTLWNDLAQPRRGTHGESLAAVFSARCPNHDTANEDAASLIPFGDDAAILMVADGVGRFRAGELASKIAIEVSRNGNELRRGMTAMVLSFAGTMPSREQAARGLRQPFWSVEHASN